MISSKIAPKSSIVMESMLCQGMSKVEHSPSLASKLQPQIVTSVKRKEESKFAWLTR